MTESSSLTVTRENKCPRRILHLKCHRKTEIWEKTNENILQPHRGPKSGAAYSLERRYLRRRDDVACARPARPGEWGDSHPAAPVDEWGDSIRAGSVERFGQPFAAPSDLLHEFSDARHFLGRPANTTQPFRAQRSPSHLDPSRLLACGVAHAVFDGAVSRVHHLSPCPGGVLAQYSPAWRRALRQLALCATRGAYERRGDCRSAFRNRTSHRHRANALCLRRVALHHQHLREYRIHHPRATQLRHRAADSSA